MIYGTIAMFFIVSIWGIVVLLQDTVGIGGISTPPAIPHVIAPI